MRYDDDHESPDLIDRRGQTYRGGGGGGGPLVHLLFSVVGRRFGLPGIIVLGIAYVGWQQLAPGPRAQADRPSRTAPPPGTDKARSFVAFVLDDVQALWTAKYPGPGRYRRAKLVLFTDRTNTACGLGQAATGPFYCPADQRAYLDLGFFRALSARLGAPGDFAQAYVIAHEIGHHVQNLTGASARVHRAPKAAQRGATGLSVRLELQADCYAGVWAHGTREKGLIEAGDLQEALRAAEAIGDDTLQKRGGGTVRPETFSHGTSAQRARWFRRGYETGDPKACDTFSGAL